MIIDSDNYDAAGIKVMWFPGGEPHVTLPEFPSTVLHIHAKLRNWKQVGAYLAVTNALKNAGHVVHVFCPYMPGARQDRVQTGFAFTAEMYANLLFQNVESITAVDVHSEAAEKIYFGAGPFHVIPAKVFAKELITDTYDCVLAPDKGAVLRAEEVARRLGINRVEYAKKDRDSESGNLVLTELPDLYDSAIAKNNGNWYRVLIVDDICDGGRTFTNIIHRALKQENHSGIKWGLYVTHGIFSQGLHALTGSYGYDGIERFYTTDSFYFPGRVISKGDPDDIHVHDVKTINLLPYYLEGLTP